MLPKYSTRQSLSTLTSVAIGGLRQHMTAEIRAQVLCSLTGDAGEGISAALQRRTPTFSNS
jgi:enoyl-CoA hydratase